MRNFKRPEMWVAVLALVLATSGGAVAASKITGAQIKDGTITAKDIKNGTIGGNDVSQDLLDEVSGAQGPAGPAGPAGAPGTPGAPGLSGVERVDSQLFSLAPGQYSPNVTANCPPGKVVIGTGYYGSLADTNFVKAYTYFVGGFMVNNSSITLTGLHFQAICASATGVVASSVGNVAAKRGAEADLRNEIARILCTSAKIGGAKKCIARGQFCSISNQKDYKRHGFVCKKDKAGRYRLT